MTRISATAIELDVATAAADRTVLLIDALRALDEQALAEPSLLPGWSRLTVACHLRYGASALLRMTDDALAGWPTAYYPEGRDRQRPATLEPAPGERPADVLADWTATAARLDERWLSLPADAWATEVREPDDNPDLGTVPLSRLALARLTEVDVHGTDLGLGLADWSETLVRVGLPARLGWLATRRTNHRAVDGTIEGTARDLLALLLGRPGLATLHRSGDAALAAAFERAFPGP